MFVIFMVTLAAGAVLLVLVLALARAVSKQRRDPRRSLANLGVVSTQWLQGHREEP